VALFPIVKTWRFQVDQEIAAGADALAACQNLAWAFKRSLLGLGSWTDIDDAAASSPAAWAIVGSSNGVAAGNNDNVDRIASAADFQPGPVQKTWYVAHNAALGIYLCFALGDGGSNAYGAFVYVSRVGFGAAHGGTNGSTSNSPTATDQQFVVQNDWGGPDTAGEASNLHVKIASDGTTRLWITRGALVGCYLFEKLGGASGWLYPVACFGAGNKDATEVVNNANLGITSTSVWAAWLNTGEAFTPRACDYYNSFIGSPFIESLTAADGYSASIPLRLIPLVSNSAGALGVIGHFEDLYLALESTTTGDCYDDDAGLTERKLIHFDALATVWPGTLPKINPNGAEPARAIRLARLIGYTAVTGDDTPPVVANVSPPSHKFDFAQFDIVEASGEFRAILCMVGYAGEPIPSDVVHIDTGELVGFARKYTGTRELVEAGRYRYRVACVSGWPLLATRFHALPIDAGGNLG
jgi:hypothetical protein